MEIIPVHLGSRTYRIVLGIDILDTLPRHLPDHFRGRRACIIADRRVFGLYGDRVRRILTGAGIDLVPPVTVPPGERSKSLPRFRQCQKHLIAHGFTRRDFVIGLGGGVPLDLAGFVAATCLRGIPAMYIPTTILAQADASVGGKTGINFAGGKNLIGAFHQPSLVFSSIQTLDTLPLRQKRNGMAEIIKMAILGDESLFRKLEHLGAALYRPSPREMESVVAAACRLKARIVARDETESGVRETLNLGHTLGHALENLPGGKKWLHGEAVALGMVAAAHVAEMMNVASPGIREQTGGILQQFRLPVKTSPVDTEHVMARLAMDKKRRGNGHRLVLPAAVGRVVVRDDVPERFIRKALEALIVD